MYRKFSWPSGLRRNVKAVVFIGVGSNPTDVILPSTRSTLREERINYTLSCRR